MSRFPYLCNHVSLLVRSSLQHTSSSCIPIQQRPLLSCTQHRQLIMPVMARLFSSSRLLQIQVLRLPALLSSSCIDVINNGSNRRQSITCSNTSLQQQQRRFISRKRKVHKKKKKCPFTVLGIKRPESYSSVKRIFLQIAMKHHPDTTAAESDEEQAEHKEIFVTARKAFEQIVEGPDGVAILKSESDDYKEEENLDIWFKSMTGHDMPFLDPITMKEVAEMTETVGGGLDRDGGMWTLARMVANNVKTGTDGGDILRLEAGDVKQQVNGILRRRRRF